ALRRRRAGARRAVVPGRRAGRELVELRLRALGETALDLLLDPPGNALEQERLVPTARRHTEDLAVPLLELGDRQRPQPHDLARDAFHRGGVRSLLIRTLTHQTSMLPLAGSAW